MAVETDTPARSAAKPSAHDEPLPLSRAAERWMQRRGVPYLLGDSEAWEHRPLHARVIVVFAGAFGAAAATPELSPVVSVVLPVGIVLAALGGGFVQRAIKGGDLLMQPGQMNLALLAAIVTGPALDALLAWEVRSDAVISLLVGLSLLLLLAAATPLGLWHITVWALGHPFREVRQTLLVIAGALPLLLLTIAFLFLTSELWDVATNLTRGELIGTLALFGALGLLLLLAMVPVRLQSVAELPSWKAVRRSLSGDPPPEPSAELDALVRECLERKDPFTSWDDVRRWYKDRPQPRPIVPEPGVLERTLGWLHVPRQVRDLLFGRRRETFEDLVRLCAETRWGQLSEPPDPPPLSFRERANLTVVIVFGQGIQMLAVTLVMGAFFLLFGRLTVDEATLVSWENFEPQQGLWGWTGEHLKVSALLAAFSGLAYAVYAALFKDQRELFFGQLDRKLTQRLAVRALYRQMPK
jgi:hypothetical protein